VIKFYPAEILGYGYDLLNYKTIKLDYKEVISAGIKSTGVLLLERLDNGPAKLFKLVRIIYPKSVVQQFENPPVYYGILELGYYIIPPKGKSRVLLKKSPRNNLIRLFEDNQALVDDMINNKPSNDDVPDIVRKYNYWFENLK
jgi:hypothetical protein